MTIEPFSDHTTCYWLIHCVSICLSLFLALVLMLGPGPGVLLKSVFVHQKDSFKMAT